MIPFNKPCLIGNEIKYIEQSVLLGKISGDGQFTKKCHSLFHEKYGFKQSLLTTSCTDALEMAAILLNIEVGDEIIAPAYTFVSTVNAFVGRGAKVVFIDSKVDSPNIEWRDIESSITSKTKAIVVVHYAGVACDMDEIMAISRKYKIPVVEDAAQAIASYYKNNPLGSIGDFGTFSFHETKNIIAGEGGLLTINDEKYFPRAEIIREKGTNRSSFFRGEIDKYGWVDVGSSFLPSDMVAAYLYAQLEKVDEIQSKRVAIWNRYHSALSNLAHSGAFTIHRIPDFATNNAHMFYIVCTSLREREELRLWLRECGVMAVFHYQSLSSSEYAISRGMGKVLLNSDRYTDCLLRLPLFYDLDISDVDYISDCIINFYEGKM